MASKAKKSTAGRKRGTAWKDAETLCLLSLWQEHSVEEQLEDPKVNNAGIYRSLALEMEEKGHSRTAEQCKIKMHTLKRQYRECKARLKKSGNGRTVCKHFDTLDAILGTRPASSPVKIIESSSKKHKCESRDESDQNSSNESESEENITLQTETNTQTETDETEGKVTEKENGNTEDSNIDTQESQSSAEPIASGAKPKVGKEAKSEKGAQNAGKGKRKKSRLEVALRSVMEGFSEANEKAEGKYIDIEKQKLQAEMKRIELERAKLDYEERQRREERQHQYNMMQMILGVVRPESSASFLPSSQTHAVPPAQQPSQGEWSRDEATEMFPDRSYFNL